eukprot:s140_g26.t1
MQSVAYTRLLLLALLKLFPLLLVECLCAMRQLLHCSAMGLQTQQRRTGPWIDGDWTAIFFAATDFGPQQVRRMAGALVATTRQSEPLGYIAQCFETAALLAPAVPAECVALESLELGPVDANWRQAAQVDEAEAAAMRKAIEERVRTEALEPWKEFLQSLDLGSTRSVQRLELFQAAENGDVDGVQKALRLGAPVNAANEYGQSAVFLAAVAGAVEVLSFLATSDADFTRCDNAGISPCQAAAFCGRSAALEEMAEVAAVKLEATRLMASQPPALAVFAADPAVVPVIPVGVDHPGAGTVVIDGALEEEILLRLERLWQKLPLAPKEKTSPTERAYFDDVEGWMTGALNAAVRSAKLNDADSTVSRVRFLIYPHPGGSLPAHVDLPRYDKNGLRSTYTFLLYLSDCISGGETTFLEALEGDAPLAPSGGVAPGQRQTLATVSPKRGRLLLMPHACPHLAAPVVEVPKVLVRGEVMPPPSIESKTAATNGDVVALTSLEDVAPGVRSRPGIPKPRVRNWILQARQVLSGQRPMAVGQAVLMWAQSFALFFKGVEEGLPHLLQCDPTDHADNPKKGLSHLQAQVPQRVPLPVVPDLIKDYLPLVQPAVLRWQ